MGLDVIYRAAPGEVFLVENSAQNQAQSAVSILHDYVDAKHFAGVYVTINKPFDHISQVLARQNVAVQRLFFIDAITRMALSHPSEVPNCLYTSSPQQLQEISVALTRIATQNPSVKFLVFDSVTTILLYNDAETVKKFFHFLTNALRQLHMVGVFLTLENTSADITNFLAALCDGVIGGSSP